MIFQLLDCGIAFALVARCYYEDERFRLGARLEKFVDQAGANSEAEATATRSMNVVEDGMRTTHLLAPVTRT
jgi:hypothetical protein